MKAAAWAVLVLGLLAVTAPRGRCSSLTVNVSFSDADPISSPRTREHIVQGEGRHNAGLLKHILNMQPPFAPVESSNPLCRQQSREFLKALDKLELWAVKMHDATGKVSSGVLNGNVNQLGDFSQCLSVGFDEQRAGESPAVSGKYCLARAYLEPVSQQRDIRDVLELVHSHKLVQSNAFDGIRFFPSFSAISWAFCVPAACSAQDVEHNLQLVASRFNSSVEGVHLHVQVDDEACVVRGRDNSLRFGTLFTMLLISSVVLMAVVGTVCDQRRAKREEAMGPSAELPCVMTRVALAFSLRRNTRDLLKTDTAYDDISCLHGLRAVFSLVIYLIHRGVFGLFVPFVNRTELAEEFEGGWTMVFRAFLNNVDTFVVLSGLLTAYYSTKKLQSGKKLSVLRMYLTRYIKFTPIFLVTVLIVRDMDYWVQSPQMMRVAQHFVNGCKNGFWKSLIYMNNLDGMDHMCYPPSHQLVTDMQMYLAAPFVILLLWKRPKLAVTLICAVLLALAPLRYLVILRWRLSTFIYHGITLSQMVDGADRMYLNPVHRLTPYLSGILLGYYLRVNGRRCRLTSEQMYAGWALAVLGGFYSFFGPSDVAQRGYEYDAHQSAMFGVLQPLLWSTALCWAIHACHTGYGGLLNRLLSWNGFVVFSKLSYAFYMVQILLIFGGIATIRAPQFYRINSVLDLNELTLLVASSVALTLLFLLPLTHLIDIATGADVRRAEVHPTTYNRFSARSQSMVDPRQLEKLQKQQAKGPRVGQLRFREGFMGFLHDTEMSRKLS